MRDCNSEHWTSRRTLNGLHDIVSGRKSHSTAGFVASNCLRAASVVESISKIPAAHVTQMRWRSQPELEITPDLEHADHCIVQCVVTREGPLCPQRCMYLVLETCMKLSAFCRRPHTAGQNSVNRAQTNAQFLFTKSLFAADMRTSTLDAFNISKPGEGRWKLPEPPWPGVGQGAESLALPHG